MKCHAQSHNLFSEMWYQKWPQMWWVAKREIIITQNKNAKDGIRTQELLRDQALNLTPLTWLGYLRLQHFYAISCQHQEVHPEPIAFDLARRSSRLYRLCARFNKGRGNGVHPFLPELFSFWYFFISRSRSSLRRIFPEMVFGSESTNSISRGYL